MGKKHKHAELIKAWADGAEIQHQGGDGNWYDSPSYPPQMIWYDGTNYRIKPAPKPDVERHGSIRFDFIEQDWEEQSGFATDNIKFIFDGETGELKSAEVLYG